MSAHPCFPLFFFFNDTATTEIYTLSLHDALPILREPDGTHVAAATIAPVAFQRALDPVRGPAETRPERDRKSTRLSSSHQIISYAVFCLKKKKKQPIPRDTTHETHRTHHLVACAY